MSDQNKKHLFNPQDPAYRATEKASPNLKGTIHIVASFLMSLVVPGLGQLFNRQWIKALVFALITIVAWIFFPAWILHLLAAIEAALTTFRQNTTDRFDDPHDQQEGLPSAT